MIRSFILCLFLVPTAFAGPEDAAVRIVFLRFVDNEAGKMGTETGYGSGTVIESADGKSLVLTCRHCCPDGGGLSYVRSGDRVYAAEWLGVDDKADLALLRVPVKLESVKVAARPPLEGARLRYWGHGGGGPRQAIGAIWKGFQGFRDEELDFEVHEIQAPVVPGHSGSGLIDEAGQLCGVVSLRFKAGDNRGGGPGLDDIRRFLATVKGQK